MGVQQLAGQVDDREMTLSEAATYSQEVASETGSYSVEARGLRAAIKRGTLLATRREVPGQVAIWVVRESDVRAYMRQRPAQIKPGRPPG